MKRDERLGLSRRAHTADQTRDRGRTGARLVAAGLARTLPQGNRYDTLDLNFECADEQSTPLQRR
jgi:hypothetical protein